MGTFDQSYTRIKILIVLFALLFFIGTCEAVFLYTEEGIETTIYKEFEKEQTEEKDMWDYIREKPCTDGIGGFFCRLAKAIVGAGDILRDIGNALASFFTTLYHALTFTLSPNVPSWIVVIMAPITISIVILILYIIADLIYDLIKTLPTT